MNRALTLTAAAWLLASAAQAEIRRDPNGVNVNAQGGTSVYITFGGLDDQVPVEALWCGELIPAAPDIGFKCDPSTVFGRLPIRFDQTRLGSSGNVFTDIMSIPPSVARRAYQSAARGETSSFFYVRRFVSLTGGPDEYVFVTCRMAGGGARTPLALLDVRLAFAGEELVYSVPRGLDPAPFHAEITYNGTGRLRGRWEVVLPGDDPPTSRDLLTEATLPPEERALQRRYTLVDRFNLFLPPTGRVVLDGPDPAELPTELDGLHQILLRIEVSDDREADSSLDLAGAGTGIVHAGAVAGFPMPVLRYYVGSADDLPDALVAGALALLAPVEDAQLDPALPVTFTWQLAPGALAYRLEVETAGGESLVEAVLQQGIGVYRAPDWLAERATDRALRWRVVAIGPRGSEAGATPWRALSFTPAPDPGTEEPEAIDPTHERSTK